MDQKTYQMLLEKYSGLKEEIYKNTVREEAAYVIAYTKIVTEIPGFHKDLEQYEIYNGTKSREQFEEIVLKRYQRWNPKGEIFECAFLQNILENMLLYLQVEEEEILDFYRRLKEVLVGKKMEILLEHRILKEVFGKETRILRSKQEMPA